MRKWGLLILLGVVKLEALIWTAPVILDSMEGAISVGGLVVDPAGNATVIWNTITNTSNVVKAASLPFDGTWSTPQILSPQSSSAAISPNISIAVNASGYVVAGWSEVLDNGATERSVIITKPQNGSWSAPTYIPGVNSQGGNAIIVDNSGNTTFLAGTTNGVVLAFRLPYGGSLSGPVTISSGNGASSPELAIDSLSNIRGIWNDSNDTLQTNLYSGGAWGSPTTVNGVNAANPGLVGLVFDNANNATVGWYDAITSTTMATTLPFGAGSWSSSQVVFPGLGINMDLNPVTNSIVMIGINSNATVVKVATLPSGGSWSSPVVLAQNEEEAAGPWLTVDPTGNEYAVWVETHNTSTHTFETSTLSLGSSTWLPPFPIDSIGDTSGGYAMIASGLPYNTVMIGVADFGSVQELFAMQGISLIAPTNPSGVQKTHKFPSQADLINELSWSPPIPFNVDYYNIYLNSVSPSNLVGTTSVPFFQHHQRKEGVLYHYFITSLNPAGEESSPATLTVP